VDPRLDPAPVVATFAARVAPVVDVIGFYAGGSLASGDFRPGVSDLDLVAVIRHAPDGRRREELRALHEATRRGDPAADKLHCAYLPQQDVTDVAASHLSWTHGRFYRRPVTGVARAELLRGGITVLGPAPAELLPDVDDPALRAAARAELTGYWSGAVRRPWLWLDDFCVELGLLTLARVDATLTDGRLITKSEALTGLTRFGVPADLVQQIARRRQGHDPSLTPWQRVRRARTARRLVAVGIRDLLARKP